MKHLSLPLSLSIAYDDSDPHRTDFFAVTFDTTGIAIDREFVPQSGKPPRVTWAELYEIAATPNLIGEMREGIATIADELRQMRAIRDQEARHLLEARAIRKQQGDNHPHRPMIVTKAAS